MARRNINRSYMKLTVWQDAIAYYSHTVSVFQGWAYEMKRVASQQIATVDSIHRNIAEGYCRKSVREYLQFLNVALSSTGESVSGLHAYRGTRQLADSDFEMLDAQAYKIENSLKRLIESLQIEETRWYLARRVLMTLRRVVRQERVGIPMPSSQYCSTPPLDRLAVPVFHHSIIPLFREQTGRSWHDDDTDPWHWMPEV
jgi:four helix bundle protein